MKKDSYQCWYCGSVFEKPKDGLLKCPCCGGPDPKLLTPEVIERVVIQYVQVPATPTRPEYYRNPYPSYKERTYSTLGYKIASGILAFAVITVIAIFAYFWFFYNLGAPKDSNPAYQNIIPTTVFTVTPNVNKSPWVDTVWMSSEESLELRSQEQVINLALLDRGGAKYSNQSVTFNSEAWQKSKPLGVTDFALSGTGFQATINGFEYNLNIFQPFVIKGQENTIYIVDTNGQIWKTQLERTALVDLEAAKSSLSIKISPNPRLTPTY